MRSELVRQMPDVAFARGIGHLRPRRKTAGVLILGFDCEYDATTQEIICYQLSDGVCDQCESPICKNIGQSGHTVTHSALLERTDDLTWEELSTWVQTCMKYWGYSLRDYSQILLVSHFSTAELSHIKNFWEASHIRRVSAAQVYNASYRINKRQHLVVMDNYHFWNVGNNGNASLAAVSQKFGEEKMVLPPELAIEKTTREYLSHPLFREYAIWDAVACARVFYKFRERVWQDHEIDIVQYPTSASIAMAVYRSSFLDRDLPCPDPQIRRQAWLSLWGGRAEAYSQGDFYGPWTLRDVVSLYPTSQRLLETLPTADDWTPREAPQTWRGLCRVSFKFPGQVKYPCLPVCEDGRLIFPLNGVSDCTLDEAKVALNLGAELDFLSVYEYEVGDRSLTDFMDFFAKQKNTAEEKDDQVGRELAKLMMNSLIGKLSQNKGDVDVEDLKAFSEKIGVPLQLVISPAFLHPEKPSQKFRIGGHIMPEWSALILGKARAVMAQLLNEVGTSLICSTDSMLVPDHLNGKVDEAMKKYGVILTNKNKGTTERVRVVRNRVYSAITKEGEIAFGASHAIHIGYRKRGCKDCQQDGCKEPTHNSLRFILSDETSYSKTRRNGLKTAIRKGEKFFAESPAEMTFSRGWDQKRLLLPDGSSRPWLDVEEYQNTQTPHLVIGE